MKRDMNLLREILLTLESLPPYTQLAYDEDKYFDRIDTNTYNLHLELLVEAGYIEAKLFKSGDGFISFALANRITYEGYEFLEAVRDQDTWIKTLEVAEITGSKTMSFLKETALKIISETASSIITNSIT